MGLKMDYPVMPEKSNFPGRNSMQRLDINSLDDSIANIVGAQLSPLTKLSHGKFRITLAEDEGRAKVHLDNSQWSGILYLSRPEDCSGGTDFFRHKETNTDCTLLTKTELRDLGWHDADTANKKINEIIQRDSNDDEKWEHIMQVPMKYNRLLLLRPWLWHTAGPGFGNTLENGRMVFLMFYQET